MFLTGSLSRLLLRWVEGGSTCKSLQSDKEGIFLGLKDFLILGILGMFESLAFLVSPSVMQRAALGVPWDIYGDLTYGAQQAFVNSLILTYNMTTGPVGDFSNARRKYITINKSVLNFHCHQLYPLIHSCFFFFFICFINTNVLWYGQGSVLMASKRLDK